MISAGNIIFLEDIFTIHDLPTTDRPDPDHRAQDPGLSLGPSASRDPR